MQKFTQNYSPENPLISAVTPAASLAKSVGLALAFDLVRTGQTLPAVAMRTAAREEIDRYDQEILDLARGWAGKLARARAVFNSNDKATKIAEYLIRGSMYPKEVVPNAEERSRFIARIDWIIGTGSPLVIAVPLGGAKVPVPLKTAGLEMPDDSESMMVSQFAALVEQLREFYGPAYFLIVPDAPLHEDLGFAPETVRRHIARLRTRIAMLGVDGPRLRR